jgi:hypothetical protein
MDPDQIRGADMPGITDAKLANLVAGVALLVSVLALAVSVGSAWYTRDAALAAKASERARALTELREMVRRYTDVPGPVSALEFIGTLRNTAKLQDDGVLSDADVAIVKSSFPRTPRFLGDHDLCEAWMTARPDASPLLKGLADAAFNAGNCR